MRTKHVLLQLITVIITIIASPLLYANASEVENGTPFEVTAHRGLNVRSRPNATRIGAVPQGSTVYATGKPKRGWLPIQYKNESGEWVHGYVFLKYAQILDVEETKSSETPTITQPKAELAPAAKDSRLLLTVNVKSRARMRSGPSTKSEIVGRLSNDTLVEIIGKPSGDWIPVKAVETGKMGWMHATLLETDETTYGEHNPLEVADSHSVSSAEAKKTIRGASEDGTEGGVKDVCESCQEKPKLDALPIPGEDGESVGGYSLPLSNPKFGKRGFGMKKHPILGGKRMHKGQDFPAPRGTAVKAYADGKVVKVVSSCKEGKGKCGGGFGNYVVIQHADGMTSIYAHLNSTNVKKGQKVKAGAKIGGVGSTGRSTGPHLHFQLENSAGKAIDPVKHMKKVGVIK